jgi:signal transduction histidine kinase/ligand-binding sensor domain-containing protein/DNA-binding response OmpR family regulator
MRLLIWLVLVILSLSAFTQSTHYNFSKLDTYTGLSNNQVNAILKDRDGFLWLGTMSGLNRYDGYSFRIFRNRPNDSSSLFDNHILALYELPNGKMWVVTRASSGVYDARTEKFDPDYGNYLASLHLPPGPIKTIIKGDEGRYCFLYDNLDLYLYSAPGKTTVPFKQHLKANASEKIASLHETKDGQLWIIYQSGLLNRYEINPGKLVFSTAALKKLGKGDNPYRLFIDDDSDVWLWAINQGVFLFHPQSDSIKQFNNEYSNPSKLNTNLISQIVQDNNGLIWIATDHGGVNLVDKKNNFHVSYLLNDPKDARSLSQNSITAVYKDDNGIIWLGTYKQGVNYLNSNIVLFPYYHHQESNASSLSYDDVNKFVEDQSGNIWIGTNGGGLIYFDRKLNKFKQYLHDPNNSNSLSSNVIVSLCIDHEEKLWIGTYFGGLNSFDGNKFIRYQHSDKDTSSIGSDNVWEIFEDNEHNLWIGTLDGGLDLFDRQSGSFQHYRYKQGVQGEVPLNFISAMLQDKKGDLWIGTVFGIAVLKNNRTTVDFYQSTNEKNRLSDNNVVCFLEDSKGRIWVGTREGLNLFNEQTKSFQIFTTSDGLPDNTILNILEDDRQTLWISTPGGLCNAIPEKKGNGIGFSIVNYDEMNNLQNNVFNDNAALKTRAGELIFGGPSGFNIINPSAIQRTVQHPKIVFTNLQILNENVEPGKLINNRVVLQESLTRLNSIDLNYKENVFSIEFASLDFAHNSRDKYAYKLEGFNTDWLYTDGKLRRATFTNLDPGHYTLKVRVLKNNGAWSAEKALHINIAPPFWRTNVAYIVYALLVAGLLYLVRRITLERMRMRFEVQQQRREAERAHLLDQLKTKFFTNVSHEFRTPLTLIISPLERIIKQLTDDGLKGELNLVQRNAKRLLSLVNQLLDFRKMEVQEVKLHPAIGDIIGFSKDICHSFMDIADKKNIRFSISSNIDNLEIYFDKDKIEKILFNLLSNAFKYTHDNGEVTVNLVYSEPTNNDRDGTLAIEIKDSGIGIPPGKHDRIFERFFQTDVPESMVNQGTGIGLAITKEFVRLHNGIITVKSEPEKGTCFTVLLPAKKIYDAVTKAATSPMSTDDVDSIIYEDRQKSGKKKTILLVEDNEDLRFYLKDNLKGQYHVEEAINGKEGWEKAKLLNPDLIVSDIMMPLMDGVEMARKIKTETLTAHIPIILLSAMGSEEKQLEGLKAGVNDYITKPFTFEILASKIRNLVAQQKLLQKRFQAQIEVNPGEVTITPVDEKFLKEALGIVEQHLDEPEFSVEDFSSEMFMSRVTLYRKILSITGKTPLEFIRSIRLKRAAQLLEKSGMTIAEIAYEVGFNNPKNFSKSFKEEFQVTPSQYLANKKERDT